jgi:ribose transport system substrate-binding protein
LKIIQSSSEIPPDGIIFHPVSGTALPVVARAAVAVGIAWVVLNREVDYIAVLRKSYCLPIFCITSDHKELGRIQGRQCAALLPKGGSVLYIQGPSDSLATKNRIAGLYEVKPGSIQIRTLTGNWTEASAYKAVTSWLKLPTSLQLQIDLIAAQNDAMAMGARKAFQDMPSKDNRDRWLSLPYVGIDGLPKTGQAWVRNGLLAATVISPANAAQAMQMLLHALQTGNMPPECTFTVPRSFPDLEQLAPGHARKQPGVAGQSSS